MSYGHVDSPAHLGGRNLYPKAVKPGDLICVRQTVDGGGYYSDAGTVRRGYYNRVWSTVLSVELKDGWYTIYNDGPIDRISSAPNAKVFVRPLKTEVTP